MHNVHKIKPDSRGLDPGIQGGDGGFWGLALLGLGIGIYLDPRVKPEGDI